MFARVGKTALILLSGTRKILEQFHKKAQRIFSFYPYWMKKKWNYDLKLFSFHASLVAPHGLYGFLRLFGDPRKRTNPVQIQENLANLVTWKGNMWDFDLRCLIYPLLVSDITDPLLIVSTC